MHATALHVNYRLHHEPRALFWTPVRQTYERLQQKGVLILGYIFSEHDKVDIAIVGNDSLDWDIFEPENKQHSQIMKSSHIDFTSASDQSDSALDMDMVTDVVFNRKARKSDHLWIAKIADLEEQGFIVTYTPFAYNPLHVRILSTEHFVRTDLHEVEKRKKEPFTKIWKKVT